MSLEFAEILVGTILVFCGSLFVFRATYCEYFLRKFLRSEIANTLTFSLAGIWFLYHILTLTESDFGEFKYIFFIFFLTIILVALAKIRDFLSVRGAAILTLLTSNELLKTAYLQPKQSRLILVVFVYTAIIFGMILGGWPYKGRDFVDFLFSNPKRPHFFGILVMCYGILVLTTLFW